MEFKITKQNFLEGLSKTQGVVERKNTMPILSNILLEVEKPGLKISATDLEVALVCQIPAQVVNPGKITVLARSLYDIVREIDQPEIKVTLTDKDRIEITAGTSRFKIPGMDAREFPAIPSLEEKSVEFSCNLFLGMIEKTAFSISTDETRLSLAGTLFESDGNGSVKVVATDGHRLSLVQREVTSGTSLPHLKVIIPRKGIGELKKIVAKEGSFEIAVGKKILFARKGNETIFVRLIDEEYPDYNRVIPEKNDKFAIVAKDKFVGALRRVSLLSDERSRGVVLTVSPGLMEISINNADLGEAQEEFEINYKSEKISIGFNARYFLEMLSVIQGESIILALQSHLTPCLIKSEKDMGFMHVIMPMRI